MEESKKKTRRPKKKRTRVRGVPYSMELCVASASQTLQLEAQALSIQLVDLQAARRNQIKDIVIVAGCSVLSTSQWRSLAAIESEKRCQAEKLNRELKVLLSEQMSIRANPEDSREDSCVSGPPNIQRPILGLNFSEYVLDEMLNSLDWLRLDTDTMLSAMDDSTKISFRWQHMPLSNCIRSTSITPVRCSM
ncbi:hypothetical protein PPTG_22146 [Phytophthora nicotianae INRA-310]|uniref:Uncharacterized protein n=1 Tax=Phytophthora nicotianae (strain INRA-310) TaxID=761204 RepID=W2QNJ6_PHYN3|nr:hypothetical protein PPTG_22146 [Phytophthora nicotianae INRA-310]ETN14541.1 hypothetical protein PPTG_22146 [Phytophthora nicotianae INRA-310]